MATTTVTQEVNHPPQQQPLPVKNILDSAMILVVTRRYPPMGKSIQSKVLQSTADAKMISATKKLFDSPELRAIIRHEEKLDEYLKWKSTPMPLRKSHHLVAEDIYPEIESHIVEHVQQREPLLDAFVACYEKAVNDSKLLLGDQFNPNDYPSKDRIKNLFRFRWEYLDFTVAGKLREINKEVAERKQQEWQETIIEAGQAADQLLTAQFKILIDHLADKLKPTGEINEDGSEKKKKMHDNMLDKINDFLGSINARNLNNNQQLRNFADQTRQLITGVSVSQLKENETLKQQVSTGFASIKDTLDKFVTEVGTRSITFED